MPHKPKMVWIRCEWCGRLKQVEARDITRGWGRFCGRKCSGRWHSANKPEMYVGRPGATNPNWRGGITKHTRGYMYRHAPDHPRASNGYVFEHVLVAEQMLGRHLTDEEVVHHKNGKKSQNEAWNIRVFPSNSAHTIYHQSAEWQLIKSGLLIVEEGTGRILTTVTKEAAYAVS